MALYVRQYHQGTGTRWRHLVSAVWEQHWSTSGCWGTRRAFLSVSRSPDCKEVFPNLQRQVQLSSRVQHPLLILRDFSVPRSPSPEGYVWIHTSAPAEPCWEPQTLVFPTRPLYPLYLSSHPAWRWALPTPGSVLRDPGAASFLKRTLRILPACPAIIIRVTIRASVFLLLHSSESHKFRSFEWRRPFSIKGRTAYNTSA